MKKMTMSEAIEWVEAEQEKGEPKITDRYGNEVFALRADNFTPVNKFRKSRYRGRDERALVQAPGVSAVFLADNGQNDDIATWNIKFFMDNYADAGQTMFLLRGAPHSDNGEDLNEVILTNHEIVAIITE